MKIPDYAVFCLNRLEEAGFPAYLVGGCVRDSVLGLVPSDYDMCTAALPEETEALFSDCQLVLAGKKHGTVGVVLDGNVVEITTFRTEGGYTDNRHPAWVRFVPTIEEDLARRDFTVNAMAWSPVRGFADPFGGRADLEKKILRAVGDPAKRFEEDSLRILRGLRFSVRYGLTPEENTLRAMEAQRRLMENLARERVFEELCKLLLLVTAEDLLRFAPILAAVMPELEPMIGFDQHSPYHAYDLYRHTACVTGAVPADLTLRWAALLHDTGKLATFTRGSDGRGHFYGHAKVSAQIANRVLLRLKAPTRLRDDVTELIGLHMTKIEPEKKIVRRWLSRLGSHTLDNLLTLQRADMGSKGTGKEQSMGQFSRLRRLIDEIQAEQGCLGLKGLAVNGHDLMGLGFQGKDIGACLNALLEQVLDETLPNDRAALLAAAKEMTKGREMPT